MMLSIYIAFSVFTTLYTPELNNRPYQNEVTTPMNYHDLWCNFSPQKCHLTVSVPMGMIAACDGLTPDTIDWPISVCTLEGASIAYECLFSLTQTKVSLFLVRDQPSIDIAK